MAYESSPAALPPGLAALAPLAIVLYVAAASAVAYAAFAADKRRAVARDRRIPEATLLWLALLGGWPGAKLAQRRLRHKTRKQPFRTLLDAIGAGQLAVVALLALVPASDLPRLAAETPSGIIDAPNGDAPEPPPPPRVWSLR